MASALNPKCVLVVDDEESIRVMIQDILEMSECKVLSAPDGPEALKIYQAHSAEINLALLDLTMPGMDGETVFTELRKLNPNLRIVLMSGYNEEDMKTKFDSKGPWEFIPKPFEFATLQEKVMS